MLRLTGPSHLRSVGMASFAHCAPIPPSTRSISTIPLHDSVPVWLKTPYSIDKTHAQPLPAATAEVGASDHAAEEILVARAGRSFAKLTSAARDSIDVPPTGVFREPWIDDILTNNNGLTRDKVIVNRKNLFALFPKLPRAPWGAITLERAAKRSRVSKAAERNDQLTWMEIKLLKNKVKRRTFYEDTNGRTRPATKRKLKRKADLESASSDSSASESDSPSQAFTWTDRKLRPGLSEEVSSLTLDSKQVQSVHPGPNYPLAPDQRDSRTVLPAHKSFSVLDLHADPPLIDYRHPRAPNKPSLV